MSTSLLARCCSGLRASAGRAGLLCFTSLLGFSNPTPPMSASPEFRPIEVPARIANLAFSYLLPRDFNVIELPEETLDFEDPTVFIPLQVTMASYGPVVFSIVARPAYGDGSVEDWAGFLARHHQMDITSLRPAVIGGMPAMMFDARKDTEAGPMRSRTALLEDGTRMINLSIMAPEAIWGSVEPTLMAAMTSFRLAEAKGSTAPLTRADSEKLARHSSASSPDATAAEAATPAAAEGEPAAAVDATAEPLVPAQLALAEDTSSFDPELPFNVRIRDAGAGLVVRVLETHLDQRYVVVGAGALEATFHVPLGWHVVDDGRRALLFDQEGKIQVSMNLRRHPGDLQVLLQSIQDENLAEQPQLDPVMIDLAQGMSALVLRNYRDGDDLLVQAYVVKQLRDDGLAHVARVTAAPEEMSRALNLAELVLQSMMVPVAAE